MNPSLGDVVGDGRGGQVSQGQVGLLVVDLRGHSDVNISTQQDDLPVVLVLREGFSKYLSTM